MKKYFVIILFQFGTILAQESQLYLQEIVLYTQNVDQTEIQFLLTAKGVIWANSQITDLYAMAEEIVSGNSSTGYDYGWRIFWEDESGINLFNPYAHTIYKLSTDFGINYIYLDFRDCKYANQSYSGTQYPTDFIILYDGSNDNFYFKKNSGSNYILIDKKSIVRIWEIKQGSPITSYIENYWQNALVEIPSQTGNQPRLVWGPHPNTSYNNGFNVYRAIVSPGQPEPAEGNFALLTPNGSSISKKLSVMK